MSITFGDQYNLLKLCPNFAPHENKDLLEAYGMMTELMRSIVEGPLNPYCRHFFVIVLCAYERFETELAL